MDITRQPRSEAGRSWLAAVLLVFVSIGAVAPSAGRQAAASVPAVGVVARSSHRHVAVDIANGRFRIGATASAAGAHRESRTRVAPADPPLASSQSTVRSNLLIVVEIDPAARTSSAADIATAPRAPPLTTPSLFR